MQAQLWSLSGLAVELGMDRRTIAKRLEDLDPDEIVKGKRTEKHWKMARVFRHLNQAGHDPQEEKARLDRLRADKVEHELDIAKGLTGSISILTDVLSNIAEQINSILGSLPLRLKKRSPKLNARDIESVRKEIVKLQNEISEVRLK